MGSVRSGARRAAARGSDSGSEASSARLRDGLGVGRRKRLPHNGFGGFDGLGVGGRRRLLPQSGSVGSTDSAVGGRRRLLHSRVRWARRPRGSRAATPLRVGSVGSTASSLAGGDASSTMGSVGSTASGSAGGGASSSSGRSVGSTASGLAGGDASSTVGSVGSTDLGLRGRRRLSAVGPVGFGCGGWFGFFGWGAFPGACIR